MKKAAYPMFDGGMRLITMPWGALHGELEVHDVAVLHDVLLAFLAELAGVVHFLRLTQVFRLALFTFTLH